MNRPWRRVAATLLALLLAGGLLWFTPTPYYVTAPGAAYDTSQMVSVAGGQQGAPGQLLMLAVTTRPANLFWSVYSLFDGRAQLENREQFLGGHENFEEYLERSRQLMADAQATAKVVALQRAGISGAEIIEQGVLVVGLTEGSPARGLLEPGDRIVSAAGRPVKNVNDLLDTMALQRPGEAVQLVIYRGEQELRLTVPTTTNQATGKAAFLVTIENAPPRFEIPRDIEIASGQISGPSAGLIFCLQILDQLTPGSLTKGHRIAGTGTIDAQGRVGAIGGVVQKVYTAEAAGAEILFVPEANYEAAARVATRIKVVAVATLDDALAYLADL